MKRSCLLFWLLPLMVSCYQESRLLVKANFTVAIVENSYTAPVSVSLKNQSSGADFYQWTFEGGSPAGSSEKTPPSVTYNKAGVYTIRLEAWNNYERDSTSFTFTVDSTVVVLFDMKVLINDFAPAQVQIMNHTQGASAFEWTFEGGNPASSTEQHPQNITFSTEGEHLIMLTANNGRATFTLSKILSIAAPLSVDFEIIPSFDDVDFQVPFTANLLNKTISGLTYQWTCTSATIANPAGENTSLTIQNAGTYAVSLTAGNEKETKTVSKEISLTANTNLFSMQDIKFGIKAAGNTVGSYYSLSQRKIFKQNEITDSNGSEINLVFFGLDAGFNQCYFVSPAQVAGAGFYAIPNASSTYFVNDLAASSLVFSSFDFDAMTNDSKLQSLNIKEASAMDTWFTNFQIPRYVLFETAGGRKGVIKIKAFVSEGQQSYLLTDLKFQKEAQ